VTNFFTRDDGRVSETCSVIMFQQTSVTEIRKLQSTGAVHITTFTYFALIINNVKCNCKLLVYSNLVASSSCVKDLRIS
jgi:hypothetical protein